MPDVMPTPRRIATPPGFRFSSVQSGYDATDDRGRRRSPPTRTMHEDLHAEERHRQILSANTRDLARNYAITSWAIRKHIDYVSEFTFQATTRDSGFNRAFEYWHAQQAKRFAFDVAGRHNQRRAIRLAEAGRCVDGDHWWLKLAPPVGNPNRGRRQLIEADRIASKSVGMPANTNPAEWINGVRLDPKTGKSMAVAICRRVNRSRKELERIVAGGNILQLAAYEFRVDQVRGVSPITSALNWFRDTYEGFEYALAKMKISQLFGLQVTRKAGDDGPFTGSGSSENQEDSDGDGTVDTAPLIDLKRGPFVTELEPGEEIKTVEGATPSTETVDFLKLMIHVALKSLDIPYSFFDESFTNFYGSRGGLIQYLHSVNNKVLDLQEFLDEDMRWRAGLAVEDGSLELPSGKDFDFLSWEYVPGGVEWWDSAKEARGAAMAIAMGASSPQRVCKEKNTNFYRNIDETAEAIQYAKAKEVPLSFGDSSAFAPEIKVEVGNGE